MMRLGWTSKTVNNGPELDLYDVEVCVIDKDSSRYFFEKKGRVQYSIWGDDPYVINGDYLADCYLEDNEYVTTSDGIKIPRCNIKNVTYKKVNERKEQPTKILLGVKDWREFEWLIACSMSGLILGIAGIITLCILGP